MASWYVEISTKSNPLSRVARFNTKHEAVDAANEIFYTRRYKPIWSRRTHDILDLKAVYVVDQNGDARKTYEVS